jgi:hypothetical protein
MRLGTMRLGTMRLGAMRLGAMHLGAMHLGAMHLGAMHLGAMHLGDWVTSWLVPLMRRVNEQAGPRLRAGRATPVLRQNRY